VLVVVDWLFVVRLDALYSEAGYLGTISSGTNISRIRTKSVLVVEAISWFGSCCGGHSVITSSKAMSEAICEFDTYSGSSPEKWLSKFGMIDCSVISVV